MSSGGRGGSGTERFSRFGDKRKLVRWLFCVCINHPSLLCHQGSDTTGYDEYVEGVEPDETSSVDTPLQEVATLTRGPSLCSEGDSVAVHAVAVWAGVLLSTPFLRPTWASNSSRRWAGALALDWESLNKVGDVDRCGGWVCQYG